MVQRADKEPWITYLEHDILTSNVSAGYYIYELSIKVRLSDILAVLRATGPDGKVVAFCSAKTLKGLSRALATQFRGSTIRWREDKYAKP